MLNWHRLFGIGLTDLFTGTGYIVELERDLSIQQQFLDVIIIEQARSGVMTHLPDGLENLAKHNLLTYKSLRESLDSWAIDELIGHYVNYRKQISEKLAPVTDFKLYAVSTRFPHKLAKEVNLRKIRPGIYETRWGVQTVHVLVLNQFAKTEKNAFWQLFSANIEKVKFGRNHYQFKQRTVSSFVNQLFDYYNVEGFNMPYTVDDYMRDTTKSYLHHLTIDERLEGLSPEQILQKVPLEQRVEGLSPEQILQKVPLEQRVEGLSPEQRLEGLSSEQKLLLLKLLSDTTTQKQ